MALQTVLVTDTFTTESIETLRQKLNYEIKQSDRRPQAADLKHAQAMLIRSRTPINQELLDLAPDLKIVITATSGYDHIDLAACQKRGVKCFYTPEANFVAAAELTLYLMLACLRKQAEVQKTLRELKWKDGLTPGAELKGKTVGLIGLGRVGGHVAKLLRAFDVEILAHDPHQDDEKFKSLGLGRLGMTEVFVQSDILSLHVPLTHETRHLIGPGTLEHCKDGFILINTSRGQVIDEGALTNALIHGQISAAGLDVFEHEPLARESRLRKMTNVIITPHIGALTHEALAKASLQAVQTLVNPSSGTEIPL